MTYALSQTEIQMYITPLEAPRLLLIMMYFALTRSTERTTDNYRCYQGEYYHKPLSRATFNFKALKYSTYFKYFRIKHGDQMVLQVEIIINVLVSSFRSI